MAPHIDTRCKTNNNISIRRGRASIPNGHATVVGLLRTFGYYVDSFAFGSPLEICGDNDAFRHIAGQWVFPRITLTYINKRNGFKGCCHVMNPVTLFQQLISNSQAETRMFTATMGGKTIATIEISQKDYSIVL